MKQLLYEKIRHLPRGRWTLPGFIVVSFLFLFLVFSGDREQKRFPSISRTNSYIEGLRIVSKKNGADSWVMTARKADFSRDEALARMDSVSMDIKKEGVILNADSGTYNMESKDLRLESNVTIQIKDSVIHAKNLSWNSSMGRLTTDGRIRMENARFTVEGEGLAATEDNKVTLMRNVKAIFF
jgi:LPS export ABC transporter protein LptC